jgi:hypothetical protein
MAGLAGPLMPHGRALLIRAMLAVTPWFLAPLAWLGVAIWGPSPQGCGGFCAVASVAQVVVPVFAVALTLVITAVILLVGSSSGRMRRARHPVVAAGLVASVPAALLTGMSVWAIVQAF